MRTPAPLAFRRPGRAPPPRTPPVVAVLAPPADAPALGAVLGLALARRERARVAVVCVWSPAPIRRCGGPRRSRLPFASQLRSPRAVTLALSEGTVTDGHGRLLAHGSSLCVLVDPPATLTERVEPAAGSSEATARDPDPWERPARGAPLEQEVWDRRSGLEVLNGLKSGELPAPPVSHLTGLRITDVTDGAVTFAMPASEWLCAPPRSRAQGGTVALLAESAIGGAIQTALPPGTAVAQIDLKVNFLRPLSTDGREAVARGRLLHAGRRIAVASSELADADGKLVALATGSAMLLPGRPASLRAS